MNLKECNGFPPEVLQRVQVRYNGAPASEEKPIRPNSKDEDYEIEITVDVAPDEKTICVDLWSGGAPIIKDISVSVEPAE